jgi:hypothetical protein
VYLCRVQLPNVKILCGCVGVNATYGGMPITTLRLMLLFVYFWQAFSLELDIMLKYPFIRKALAMITKQVPSLNLYKNGGVITVDLEGKPTTHYYDPKLSLTGGIKIGNHLYCGSILYPFVIRLDIEKYPALPTI